ncbi:hypothetical protein H4582DRAFT_2088940 [Lactarius indigo]|nr:hypothetical protein H4582DRAFT_2088940 [Lactarius indigo]
MPMMIAEPAQPMEEDQAYDPGYTSSVEDLYLVPAKAPAEMVCSLQINEGMVALHSMGSSMHNPANAMEDNPSIPRGQDRAVDDGPLDLEVHIIAAVHELLAPLTVCMEHLADTICLVDLRTCPGPHPLPVKPTDLCAVLKEPFIPSPEVMCADSPPMPALAPLAPVDTPTPEPALQGKEGGLTSSSTPPKAPHCQKPAKRTGMGLTVPL